VGQRPEEVRVARGIEEAGALRPGRQDTHELAALPERHRHLRVEGAERVAHPLRDGRVGVTLRRVERREHAAGREESEQRPGHRKDASDFLETFGHAADEQPSARVGDRTVHAVPDQPRDVIPGER
jgi:hypothetical protein